MNLRFLLPLVLFLGGLSIAQGQFHHIQTDKSPSFIFNDPVKGHIHVITLGVDANFDGVFQPGSDVAPRWFVLDAATEEEVGSTTFTGFFNSFPLRAGVDLKGRRLYVPQLGRVRAFDIDDLGIVQDSVSTTNASTVMFDSLTGYITLSFRPGFTVPGWTETIDPRTGKRISMMNTGVNPGMAVPKGAETYTITEGGPGIPSTVAYSRYRASLYAGALGGNGNHMVVRGTAAYLVMSATNQIRIIDTRTGRDTLSSPIAVGTAGFGSPRMLDVQGDSVLVVATYARDIRRFRIATGAMIDKIALPGAAEAVAVRDSLAYVAIPLDSARHTDSLVVVVNLNSGRPVDTLAVGPNPLGLFIDRLGNLQVVVADTIPGAGRLVSYERGTLLKKGERPLHGAISNPLHMAYDNSDDSLFIVLSDTLFAFAVSGSGSPLRAAYTDTLARGALFGVSGAGDYLLITERPKNPGEDSSYVHIVSRKSGGEVAKFMAGYLVMMALPVVSGRGDHAMSFYALNQGGFAATASTLTSFEFQPDILGPDTLGSGANHITLEGLSADNDKALVTMNGNHSVVRLDLDTWTVMRRTSTKTTGFDGPRETMALSPSTLLVSTYAGDVRRITVSDNSVRVIPVYGKAEGMARAGSKVYVALPFAPDATYTPSASVAVIDTAAIASVRRDDAIASATTLEQNYPNPVSSGTEIRFSVAVAGRVTLALYRPDGALAGTIVDREMEPGSYTARMDVAGLASGSYIYTLRSGGTLLSRVMKVVR
ncbi:MAG: Endonuclease/exonuclease/phosphatase [Chlorobi bacterium]|nr:Endonuclease/exonuclease/phosphatase [Chlorobiota bacterium]